jgi:hypothetical protein
MILIPHAMAKAAYPKKHVNTCAISQLLLRAGIRGAI